MVGLVKWSLGLPSRVSQSRLLPCGCGISKINLWHSWVTCLYSASIWSWGLSLSLELQMEQSGDHNHTYCKENSYCAHWWCFWSPYILLGERLNQCEILMCQWLCILGSNCTVLQAELPRISCQRKVGQCRYLEGPKRSMQWGSTKLIDKGFKCKCNMNVIKKKATNFSILLVPNSFHRHSRCIRPHSACIYNCICICTPILQLNSHRNCAPMVLYVLCALQNYVSSKVQTKKEILKHGQGGNLEVVTWGLGLIGGDTILPCLPHSVSVILSQWDCI